MTQAEVVAVGIEILDTTKSRVNQYFQVLYDAYVERYATDDPAAVLELGRVQLH